MAEKKYLDENGLLYYHQKAKATFVAQESGKGLSTNDYTTAEKNKLAGITAGAEPNTLDGTLSYSNGLNIHESGNSTDYMVIRHLEDNDGNDMLNVTNQSGSFTRTITTYAFNGTAKRKLAGIEAGAEVNDIDTIKVNGTAQTITDKAVDITVPTNNNQLTNGAGYQTASEVQTAINSAISGITGISIEVVSTLPATGENGVIYLVSNGGSSTNTYDEYIWLSNASRFEKIGTTDVDLSNYYTKTEVDGLISSAGEENVIEVVKVNGTALTPDANKAVNIGTASTSAYGVTKLSSSTSSTSTSLAATASAVKAAYDLANGKQSPATTLAGYGITDAYTKTTTDSTFQKSADLVAITNAEIDTIVAS